MTMTEAEVQIKQTKPKVEEANGAEKSAKCSNLEREASSESLQDLPEAEVVIDAPIDQDAEEQEMGKEFQGTPETNGRGSSRREHQQSRAERLEKQIELDSRSIFVGNITSEATAESLEEHFKDCGEIVRVTILYNKVTGAPKGYAYIEFENADSVVKALQLKDSELHGENLNVAKKRTNVPGYNNNKSYYQRKEWIYPGWQQNVVRQWYYPYTAQAYQSYKPNGMPIPPPQNAFYPQYAYIPRPTHNSGVKIGGYSRGGYRGNYRGGYINGYNGNYNGNYGNNYNTNYNGGKRGNQKSARRQNSNSSSNENADTKEVPSQPSKNSEATTTDEPIQTTNEDVESSKTVGNAQ